jgi:hypothetical protein|tara:strand:+ start:1687 stop:1953 length:267 start_codon:yes stop_codon:yes gene_type:complete
MEYKLKEIEFLKTKNLDLDYEELDRTTIFIYYLFTQLIHIAENKGGVYTVAAVKKAQVLKKSLASPLLLRAVGFGSLLKTLREAGVKL